MNSEDITLAKIKNSIITDKQNEVYTNNNFAPIYQAGSQARILIVGQAPGLKAQNSATIWNDKSGDRLRMWLGVSREQFFDPNIFALIPMDFYYPGKGQSGDLPPRQGFAEKWHPQLLAALKHIELIVLIGTYAQNYYLKDNAHKSLTETVRNYKQYLPTYFPLSHPSPLNFRWRNKNLWFEQEVIPTLNQLVQQILNKQ